MAAGPGPRGRSHHRSPPVGHGREPRLLCSWKAPGVTGVFADAFYYIALFNTSDQFHEMAVRASLGLHRPLVTTTWVLVEVADALVSPTHRRLVHRFLGEAPARQGVR